MKNLDDIQSTITDLMNTFKTARDEQLILLKARNLDWKIMSLWVKASAKLVVYETINDSLEKVRTGEQKLYHAIHELDEKCANATRQTMVHNTNQMADMISRAIEHEWLHIWKSMQIGWREQLVTLDD